MSFHLLLPAIYFDEALLLLIDNISTITHYHFEEHAGKSTYDYFISNGHYRRFAPPLDSAAHAPYFIIAVTL